MYAKYATAWEAPPRGTRHGHYRRYSLRALGAFSDEPGDLPRPRRGHHHSRCQPNGSGSRAFGILISGGP